MDGVLIVASLAVMFFLGWTLGYLTGRIDQRESDKEKFEEDDL